MQYSKQLKKQRKPHSVLKLLTQDDICLLFSDTSRYSHINFSSFPHIISQTDFRDHLQFL